NLLRQRGAVPPTGRGLADCAHVGDRAVRRLRKTRAHLCASRPDRRLAIATESRAAHSIGHSSYGRVATWREIGTGRQCAAGPCQSSDRTVYSMLNPGTMVRVGSRSVTSRDKSLFLPTKYVLKSATTTL